MEIQKKVKCFLVKYLNHAKKVENPTEENIRQLFCIACNKNIFVQYYDHEFEDFVDVNWSDILEVDSRRLQICEEPELVVPKRRPCDLERGDTQVSKEENYQETFSDSNLKDLDLSLVEQCSESDASINKDSSHSSDKNLGRNFIEISSNIEIESTLLKNKKPRIDKDPLLFRKSSPKITSRNPCVINMHSPSIEIIDQCKNSSPSFSNTDANKDDRPRKCIKRVYPTSYVLPTINPTSRLGIALKNEQSIHSKCLKGEFLMNIYESFAANKKFYVEEGYDEIVNAILNAYPYLGEGLSYQAAKHYWTKSLRVKFCNERKRTDHREEAVITMKKKNYKAVDPFSRTTPKDALKYSVQWGIPNYCPPKSLCDEDKISVDSHKKWMKLEMKKAKKNISEISLRMDLSFKQRRSLLFTIEDGTPTNNVASDILKEYPCLKIEDQAIEEVERLFGTNEKYEKYLNCITIFSQKINDLVCSSKSKFKPYMDDLFSFGNSLNHEVYVLYKLIGNISVLVGEDPKEIISYNLNETHCPMLHLDNGVVNINVDGATFISGVSARNCSFLWIGAFYIFNVQPVRNRKSFDVVQYLFFEIPDKISKFPQASVRIIQLFKKICDDTFLS